MIALDFGAVLAEWPQLARGAAFTVGLTAVSAVLGVGLGVACGWARAWGPAWLKAIVGAYVELIRNTPFIVQLFFVFFGLPAAGVKLTPEIASVIAMVINLGAYAAEIIRAGIEATPKGQFEAAASLALSRVQTFLHVVLPPALKKVWPALTSQIIIVMLGSAVCGQISTQELSYAANLYGNVEEEHAGGALAFPSYNLGEDFQAISQRLNGRTFADVARDYARWVDVRPEGYGVDKVYPDLLYVPEDAFFSLPAHRITWKARGKEQSIPLLAGKVYMTPSGYKVRMERHPGAPSWRLIGTVGDGTLCHKPCTDSGGGNSEISTSIIDYRLYGPIFVADIEKDLDLVQEIFARDYSKRWRKDGNVKPE